MKNLYLSENQSDIESRHYYSIPGETDPLSVYLKQISQYPLLQKQEELDIGKNMKDIKYQLKILDERFRNQEIEKKQYLFKIQKLKADLEKNKNKMITSNLRLVVSIAKKFQHRGLKLLDLIDEGNIGLIEAVERFDCAKGCKFSTYGTWWIQQSIIKSLADKGRIIRIPIHVQNVMRKCFSVSKHLTQRLGRNPNNDEVAEYLNIPEKKVDHIMRLSKETASLDTTVDEENLTSLSDLICNEKYVEPFEEVFDTTLHDILKNTLKNLTPREKDIIQLRFGICGEGPLTLEDIGQKLGITRERVRQIQNKAIAKLRNFKVIEDLKELV